MQSIINRIENNQFWKFHGGIHPPEQKFLTNSKPIKPLHLPELLIIPVQQHIGVPGDILVNVGDTVLKGQSLTAPTSPMAVPVHAPTSGTIEKIALHVTAHPSGLSELCIFLKPDGQDKWRPRELCEDYKTLDRSDIIRKITDAGISGMGGAGFPTHIKVDSKPNIDFLIINAAECEPYITADDLLMREHSATILDGINILRHLLIPRLVLIGIEDNKPEAIEALKKATADINDIHVCVVPTKYPMGGEKQLIKALTGKEITSGGLPIQQGIVMQNVATCYAIADAVINDKPLIERVVTVSGQGLEKPQNIWAALGTPVRDLVSLCHSTQPADKKAIIMGGPMMGFTLPIDTVPVVKTTNCVLVPSEKELNLHNTEVECIRCGQCAEVCPSKLLPQELQWSAKAKDHDKLKALNLFDCIDCGACAYVCPSHIPLVQYYRVAKAEIRQQELQDIKAEKAKARFEARKARLERERKAREEKQRKASEARRAAMNNSQEGANAKSAVAAALARVKAKKAQDTGAAADASTEATTDVKTEALSPVQAAIARAKAKKAAQAAQSTEVNGEKKAPETSANVDADATPSDDKQSKVAAAVTRAKAKKAAKAKQEAASQTPEEQTPAKQSHADEEKPTTDSKQAKVAAAVAKAKARKQAKAKAEQAEAELPESINEGSAPSQDEPVKADVTSVEVTSKTDTAEAKETTDAPANDKKAKIAAAIAKAKAKKAKQSSSNQNQSTDDSTIESPVKAPVESKANSTTDSSAEENDTASEAKPANDKKAKVAAAIAKAKAKKATQASNAGNSEVDDTTEKADTKSVNSAADATKTEVSAESLNGNAQSAPAVSSISQQKKARIAAAVAKAKAKKQQQAESN
ncbi:MAG: electron transport complex subunit RsxC [Colwelliaceae bacterium]|nr:electron transport complex subunit RsxC [Colwelliaceae bacterium]